MEFGIIGLPQVENLFDKVNKVADYKNARIGNVDCAFLRYSKNYEANLMKMKQIGVNKVLEISREPFFEKNKSEMCDKLGLEYIGLYITDDKYVKSMIESIVATSGEENIKEEKLTNRENEILELISEGNDNKTIGRKLYISEKTVKNHITNILKKLKLADRTQAAIYYLSKKGMQ